MDRLKTFGKYILWIVGFWLFSNILIFVGLNANYDNIDLEGQLPNQIEVSKAEATLVNGRIRGQIQNKPENNLNGKFIKINLYSERDNILGTKYIQIANLGQDSKEDFSTYFKVKDVASYSVEITNKAEKVDESLDVFMTKEMKFYTIVALVVFAMII